MIELAARDFDLELDASFVVGDKYLDMELAFYPLDSLPQREETSHFHSSSMHREADERS
jgi:histidinol phosphatase-like enzyme